jgi:probable F420-dependent oxidoreductase
MKVDYYFAPEEMPDTTDRARWAAEIGYDGMFTSETKHDPFLPVMAANRGAPGLDVGTAIAVAFGRSPMTVAYTAWDLAALTKGKFLLGLGTQIRPHITRRFSMPWSSPGPRLREYIEALRAIWRAWQEQSKLSFKGDFYDFTLMTPFFDPGPIDHPDVPIYIAGVGQYLSQVAGEVTDGFHAHPFHTRRYLEEVVKPNIAKGAAARGRDEADVEMVVTSFLVTGRDEEEIANCEIATKLQIAFYASTPTYRGVLELHGWEDIGPELTTMSKQGNWLGMGALISDEMVDELAVRAPLDELGTVVRDKYAGVADRLGFYFTELPGQGPVVEPTDEEWSHIVTTARA